MHRRTRRYTLFPYTTLFRSQVMCSHKHIFNKHFCSDYVNFRFSLKRLFENLKRSEEHTSELQSPDQLVCRLLREKKKRNNARHGDQVQTVACNVWTYYSYEH